MYVLKYEKYQFRNIEKRNIKYYKFKQTIGLYSISTFIRIPDTTSKKVRQIYESPQKKPGALHKHNA